MMGEILEYLKANEFVVDDVSVIIDNGEVSHVYTRKDDLSYCIIAPHSGNNFKYLLRINATKTLDRWSMCDIEKEFTTPLELTSYLSTQNIYKELLNIYVDYYLESEN